MIDITIENMVAKIDLDIHLDLVDIVSKLDGIEYNPENFPGAIIRFSRPKVAVLLFSTGKAICTGANVIEDVNRAVDMLIGKLEDIGISVSGDPSVEIQNMVASADLGMKVNLDKLAIEGFNVEYEPEQFPGLINRISDPKVVVLIFRSGKIIVTGARNRADAKEAARLTRDMIDEYKAIIP